MLVHQGQGEFCLISVGSDFTFNDSFVTWAEVFAGTQWVGIVQRMKKERDTLTIETLPEAKTTASPVISKHSEDSCLYAIALPKSASTKKSFNGDLKED